MAALLGAAAVGMLAQAAIATSGDAGVSKTRGVSVRDDFFSPKRATIRAGDRVKWTWREQGDHNVRFRRVPAGAGRKPGERTKSSGTFSRRFTRRGTYRYVCTIHEDLGMTGSVKVE